MILHYVDSLAIAAMSGIKVMLGGTGAVNEITDATAESAASDITDLLNGTGAESGALSKPNQLVQDYGRGVMNIGRNAFVYILAFCLLLVAIGFVVHGCNQQKLAEKKSGLGWIIVGGVLGFGVVSIVVLLETIGKSLFN